MFKTKEKGKGQNASAVRLFEGRDCFEMG